MSEIRNLIGNEAYKVTSDGNIIGQDGIIKRTRLGRDGYLKTNLCEDGKKVTKSVHRLIAKTFIPNPDNKPQVNHKNGIKTDNRVENLEWVTASENVRHALANNLTKRWSGEKHHFYGVKGINHPAYGSKSNKRIKVRIVETNEEFDCIRDCAYRINGNERHISDCLCGRRKSHRGYHFERV